jgi:hypothetical protein
MKVPNASFKSAVDRVSTIASERGRAVKLNVAKDKLILTVNNPEGGSATEEIAVGYGAGPLEIGFNARYLLDIAEQLESEDARFLLADQVPDDGPGWDRQQRPLRADADAGVGECRLLQGLWVERLALTNFPVTLTAVVETDAVQVIVAPASCRPIFSSSSLLAPGQGLQRRSASGANRRRRRDSCSFGAGSRIAGHADIGWPRQVRRGRQRQAVGTMAQNSRARACSPTISKLSGLRRQWTAVHGPASERLFSIVRSLLRSTYRAVASRFERAMTSRNRLLADGVRDNAQLSGLSGSWRGPASPSRRLVSKPLPRWADRRQTRTRNRIPHFRGHCSGSKGIEDDLQRLSAVEAEDAMREHSAMRGEIARQCER